MIYQFIMSLIPALLTKHIHAHTPHNKPLLRDDIKLNTVKHKCRKYMQRTEKMDTEIHQNHTNASVYSVRLAMGWITRIWFLVEAGTVLTDLMQISMETSQALTQWVQEVLDFEIKKLQHKAKGTSKHSGELKNVWSYTSTTPHLCMEQC